MIKLVLLVTICKTVEIRNLFVNNLVDKSNFPYYSYLFKPSTFVYINLKIKQT
jgi:hypothetical protein